MGVFFFGVNGVLVLGLRTNSPIVGVSGNSMTHGDNVWADFYSDNEITNFPFQEGINQGDLVFVKGANSIDELKVGDVVVWRDRGKRIIHRVAIKKENFVVTRGDNNRYLDRKIGSDEIIGKAVISIPYLGYPSLWGAN